MTENTAPTAQPPTKKRPSPLMVTVLIVAAIIVVFLAVAGVLADVFWFDQLGFLNVLLTQWGAAAIVFVIGFLAMAIPVFFAIDIAYRTRPVYARLTAQLDHYQEMIEPLRRLVKYALPAVLGIFAGLAAGAKWQTILLWLNSEPSGKKDPEFGFDISFFLFDLPFWQSAVSFASAVVLIALIASVGTSYLYGGIAFNGKNVRISKATRIQTAVTATLFLAIQAVSLWLDQYRTVTDASGIITGAAYTDVNAVIPSKGILAAIALLVALFFLVTAFTGKWRLPVVGTALLLVSSLVIGAGYPWFVQRFQVGPDEKSLELEYIQRNIDATRDAYGIADVEVSPYQATTDAEPGALRDDAVATSNIRILDPEIVSPTFGQLEQIRPYYKIPKSLDVDRYTIDGKVMDTVSGIRDINIDGQDGWFNRTLVYTHGYGLVAAYGNQRSGEGLPVFLESGIPTQGELGDFQPRVYFGENSPEYSIVGGTSKKDVELDYPAGEDGANQTYNTFDGDGGPVIDNIFKKLVFALKFQSEQIVLSGAVTEGSQILFNRDPAERVQKVAPYLTLDSDPYASVVDGRIVWIVDGYTTSSNYPYSRLSDMNDLVVDADNPERPLAQQPVNYIRNSVKATVDAYDGKVTLYAWDDEDPILKTWQNVFPTTVKSVSEMSGDLLSHVRYPADMFKVQRSLLGLYHVTDAGAFYSKEDAWRTPNDPVSGGEQGLAQPPYYLTLSPDKDAEPTYSIYSTFIPNAKGEGSRDVLTGFLSANANAGAEDGKPSEDYGKLKLLTLPKGDTVPAPGQVQNSFTTDTEVTRLLNLLRQGESNVISGNLLTLPVGGGLLYVQPVYVQAKSGTSYPVLQKVLVSFGEKIAFEDTLDQALDTLFGGDSGANAGDTDVPVTEGDTGTGTGSGEAPAEGEAPAPKPDVELLTPVLQEMKDALEAREAAMKKGDWAAYGKADERLQEAIAKALAAG